MSIEVHKAMERHDAGDALLVPVMVRPCTYEETPFRQLQYTPAGKPITMRPNQDQAFSEVARAIGELAAQMRSRQLKAAHALRVSPTASASAALLSLSKAVIGGASEALVLSGSSGPEQKKFLPDLVKLPAGTFMMGSPESERDRQDNEGPQHQVRIGYRFELGAYPITFDEYDFFCEATDREKPGDGGKGRGRRPVIFVSWFDAVAYCEWLRKETKQHFRLPSEAEWEYACRSGTATRYSVGDVITPDKANYTDSGYARATEVDLYPANPWGLFDMHGNVDEWVEDVWHECYEGAPTDGSAWTDGEESQSASLRVVRGGSWNNYPFGCRSACRSCYHPRDRSYSLGFRVARTL